MKGEKERIKGKKDGGENKTILAGLDQLNLNDGHNWEMECEG